MITLALNGADIAFERRTLPRQTVDLKKGQRTTFKGMLPAT
jgi:hypothetical protein